jgi:hypothetical protein
MRQTFRFTNSAILASLVVLTLTGLYGLVSSLSGWVFELHRFTGWALIALVPWKAVISVRSLRRGIDGSLGRSLGVMASILLTGLIVLVGGMGLGWMWRLGPTDLRLFGLTDSLLSWHWMLGFGLAPFVIVHSIRNWPRPKREDYFNRRGFLRIAGLTAAGAAGWWGAETLARSRPGSARRWTGSREQGSFGGNDYPVTSMARDGRAPIALEDWSLRIGGRTLLETQLDYEQILALPQTEVVATLDCTVGWYTTQTWSGIRLSDLLDNVGLREPRRLVRLKAYEGYSHAFTAAEVNQILLATHVSGEILQHRHGYPLRAVVPTRRGWFWVKWLSQVEVLL